MAHCVNHNDPQVIKLANDLNETPPVVASYIALMQERSGDLDTFPSKKELSDFMSEMKVRGRGIKSDASSYYYESNDVNGNVVIPKSFSEAALKDDPKKAADIIDDLRKKYPEVIIMEGGILTPDGLYVPVTDNVKGLHYRDAFISAVSWANDSLMEVPPHEYAEHYIDMFQNHPLVREGITKYGKEGLARAMGNYYLQKEMSPWFKDFVGRFWSMVKSLFGNSDVRDILSEKFHKGERLGEESVGTGEVSYFAEKKDMHKKKGEYHSDVKSRFYGALNVYGNHSEMTVKVMEDNLTKKSILHEFGDEYDIETNSINDTYSEKTVHEKLIDTIDNMIRSFRRAHFIDGQYRNPDQFPDEYFEDLMEFLKRSKKENPTALNDIIKNLLSETEQPMAPTTKDNFNFILSIKQKLEYANNTKNTYHSNNGKVVSAEEVNKVIEKEIRNTRERRKKVYDKVKYPWAKKALEFIETKLQPYFINKLTLSMFVSGSERSAFSQLFYHSLVNSGKKYDALVQKIEDINTLENIPKNYDDWSYIKSGKKSIDKLVGKEFQLSSESDPNQTVKLTNQEIANIYLIQRQDKDEHGSPTPKKTFLEKGLKLSHMIDGRNVTADQSYLMSEEELGKLVKYVESEPTMMEQIRKIDMATDEVWNATNNTFKQEMGYNLRKMEGYFPIYTSFESDNVKSSFSSARGLSSGKHRLGSDEPLMVGDALDIFNNYKNQAILYSSYALEISNNRKMIEKIRPKFIHDKLMDKYFDQMIGTLNDIETGGTLYVSRGESDLNKGINKLGSNLALSVITMNFPVVMKQPIGYHNASMEIDKKYLAKAGWTAGGMVGINPKDFVKTIKYTGVKGGETWMPLEYQIDDKNPNLKEIKEHSPTLYKRTMGMVSREGAEAFMDMQTGDDKIHIPVINVDISKKRTLSGIIAVDSVTMMKIWEAVKHETLDLRKELTPNSNAFWEHVAERTEYIYEKTQPTDGVMGKSSLEQSSNPIARMITMFGSARSKMANNYIQDFIRFIENPSKENRRKLLGTTTNIFVYSALSMAAIDVLSNGLRGKFKDDDDWAQVGGMSFATNALGNFWGVGELARMIMSRIDDQPWTASLEHPFQALVNKSADSIAHLYNGDFDKAFFKMGTVILQLEGLPSAPLNYSKDIYDGMFGK